jgi:vacuolar-type H+-ATPase catalytic subunit A/Vma1
MSPLADASDLTIDAEWDNMCDDIVNVEEDIPSSSKEVCRVLEEWTSDEESVVDMDIMEVDEQIGSNFLSDDLFGGVSCNSPVTPQEELMSMNVDDMLRFPEDNIGPFCREAFLKLAESMRRSRETRKALIMMTTKADEEYIRRQSITAVLASIEKSGTQLQNFFGAAPIA